MADTSALPLNSANAEPRARWLLAAAALLVLGSGMHVWYLVANCPLDLSGDEAHYWEWSRRLDWSYYSKGPLVAWIIAAGRALFGEWSQRLVASEMLAVRLPAILLSIATGMGMFVLARNTLRNGARALATIALLFTTPILAAGAMLMTIDAPLMCAWTWALVFAERALRFDRLRDWLAVGGWIAAGVLAKYTMVLLYGVVGALLLADPHARRLLRRPGPYLAAAAGLLGFVPIVVWNWNHDWVSFRHVAGQAGARGDQLDLLAPLQYLLGQFAVVNPVWFTMLLVALWRGRPALASAGGIERAGASVLGPVGQETERTAQDLLWFATATPLLVFLAFSPITKIQPNWPVIALASGLILVVQRLAQKVRVGGAERRRGRAIVATGALVGLVMVLIAHRADLLFPLLAPLAPAAQPWNLTPMARFDPSARLRGWSALGVAVGETVAQVRARGGEPFIVTDDYQVASEIAFYAPGQPVVYCVQSQLGDRRCQYDLWPNPVRDAEAFIGRPCIYVGSPHPALTGASGSSAAMPGLHRTRVVEHRVRGHLVQVWSLHVCDAFAGFESRAPVTDRY